MREKLKINDMGQQYFHVDQIQYTETWVAVLDILFYPIA